jgi:hypothetical protein
LAPLAASRANESGTPLAFVLPEQRDANISAAKGPADQEALEVTGAAGISTTIAVLNDPPISTHTYVVRGRVKYEGVAGDGYLELWNDFGPRGKFFTRSLAPWGKLGKLSGTSGWREFELPFYAEPGMRPTQLTLNVVLPGAGKVTVASPVLIDGNSTGEWLTASQSGLFGGILGSLLGISGGLIGLSAAWSRLRPLTIPLCVIDLVISGVAFLVGVVAVCLGQPWHVYYPLLLVGVIGVTVIGSVLWQQVHRFRDDELRRITAVDA